MREPDQVPPVLKSRNFPPVPVAYGVCIESPPDAVRARLQHCLSVLERYRWAMCLFVAICTIVTWLISARLSPVYESAATIDIDRRVPAGVLGQNVPQFLADADQFLATQLKVIQSDSVLRPVVRSFGLPVQENQDQDRQRATADSAGEAPVELKGLRVARLPNTYLLQIRYRSSDPKLAAVVANAIANSYIQHSYTIRYNASASLSGFMEGQLAELKTKMERSSVALANFERELNVINPEDRTSILSARLLHLNTEYTNAQSDRVRKEAVYMSVRSGSPEAAQSSEQGEALRNLSLRLDQAEEKFAQVKAHYGVNHPEYRRTQAQVTQVQSQVQAERQKLMRAVEVDYSQAAVREKMLEKIVRQNKAELDSLNVRSYQYQTLKRDAEADRKLYEELTRTIKEAGVNAAFQNSAIRLADPARPPMKPVFPRVRLNLLLAFLFSGVIAAGAAFLADALDHSVRDPKRIARLLNTDVIGTLPVVKGWRRHSVGSVTGEQHTAPALATGQGTALVPATKRLGVFDDAIYTLLHSILLGSGEHPPRSILISSAFPKEGKTTIATHLAIAHARQKHRTLLIDGDLRCPAVSTLLRAGGDKGLSNALRNGMKWRLELAQTQSLPELDILAAGPDSLLAADLASNALSRVLEEAKSQYDLVLVDAPPLLGFPEPLEMAAAVEGVLVVARAGGTREQALDSVIGMLQRIRANVVGVVLNEAPCPGDGSRYYGYARARQSYAQYWHAG